jgi:hypothetical protein
MDAAKAIEGGIRLAGDAGSIASGEYLVEVFDHECGMGALRWCEIGFDTEVKIYGAGHKPDAFALSHLRRLGDLGKAEDAGIEGASAVFTGDGDGNLYVVDVQN